MRVYPGFRASSSMNVYVSNTEIQSTLPLQTVIKIYQIYVKNRSEYLRRESKACLCIYLLNCAFGSQSSLERTPCAFLNEASCKIAWKQTINNYLI